MGAAAPRRSAAACRTRSPTPAAPICSSTRTTRSSGSEWGDETLAAAQARGQADPALGRLRRLPLVPCHGARELREPGGRGADEPRLRQHQGRPRGAAGHRRHLPARAGADGRAGRLAADHVPDARRASRSGAAPISRPSRATAGRASRRCWSRSPGSGGRTADASTRAGPLARRPCSGSPRPSRRRAARRGLGRARGPRRSPSTSTRSMAASAARPNSRRRRVLELIWRTGTADRRPHAAPAHAAHPRAASARAASTTISAAASPATRSTPSGWCRISRRCSTTTPSCSTCWRAPGRPRGEPLFRAARRPRRSAGCEREMTGSDGAFAASLDADSEGEEGRFYVWYGGRDRRAARRPTLRRSALAYGVTAGGNWEGKHDPQPAARAGPARAGRGRRAAPLPRRCCSQARERPRAPGPRRQGAGGLERPDDRGAGRGAGLLRPARLAGPRARAPSLCPCSASSADGRPPAHSWRDGRARSAGVRRRLRADCAARRWRCSRQTGDRRTSSRRATGSRRSTATTGTRQAAATSSPDDDRAGLIPRQDRRPGRPVPVRQRHDGRGRWPSSGT